MGGMLASSHQEGIISVADDVTDSQLTLSDDMIETETILRKNSKLYDFLQTEFNEEYTSISKQGIRMMVESLKASTPAPAPAASPPHAPAASPGSSQLSAPRTASTCDGAAIEYSITGNPEPLIAEDTAARAQLAAQVPRTASTRDAIDGAAVEYSISGNPEPLIAEDAAASSRPASCPNSCVMPRLCLEDSTELSQYTWQFSTSLLSFTVVSLFLFP